MGILDRFAQNIVSRSGVYNMLSGLGLVDKVSSTDFEGSASVQSETALRYYRQSWFIKALVDVPVDDMFVRWREYSGDNATAFRDAEDGYGVRQALAGALKAGRLFGTGLLVLVLADDDPSEPLDVSAVRRGDIRRLHVASNATATIDAVDANFGSPTYGQPVYYGIRVGNGGSLRFHASRVLRFDGVPPQESQVYELERWGTSVIETAISASRIDAALSAAIGHLSQEASIPVLKIKGLNEQVARSGFDASDDATPTINKRVSDFNRMKGNYRTSVIDTDDDLTRVDIRWGQLPGVVEVHYKRLAAIAQMPATRLLGQSPAGMNATGESDLRNWAASVAAMQESQLSQPLSVLDEVVARSAGIAEPPPYEFLDLLDLSISDKASAAQTFAGAVATLVNSGIVDESEARVALDETGLFGDLDDDMPNA